jgi:hypothetical protein
VKKRNNLNNLKIHEISDDILGRIGKNGQIIPITFSEKNKV